MREDHYRRDRARLERDERLALERAEAEHQIAQRKREAIAALDRAWAELSEPLPTEPPATLHRSNDRDPSVAVFTLTSIARHAIESVEEGRDPTLTAQILEILPFLPKSFTTTEAAMALFAFYPQFLDTPSLRATISATLKRIAEQKRTLLLVDPGKGSTPSRYMQIDRASRAKEAK